MINRNKFLKYATCLVAGLIIASNVLSQCTNQVTDTLGTHVVSGVSVTVTSFGTASINTVYCASTSPYIIGHLIASGLTTNSGYTFQFTPPVDSITLNFSGISNTAPFQEIVMVEINGIRYSIPSPGALNGCDVLAVLTPEGYITGCNPCSVSGWNGTTIAGPVSMVTVIDSAALNGAGGNQALFSLFFCDSINNTGIADNIHSKKDFLIYPNPSAGKINIHSNTTYNNYELYNIEGKLLKKDFLNDSDFELDLSYLNNGMYFLKIGDKENQSHRIVIKE
ncbi:MAG: T9SS type A sorting domain-containing protein [Bacteroidota bacterium]